MIDLTSAYRGITTPMPVLTSKIEELGWQLKKVHFTQGAYSAKASNSHGEKIERTGITDKTAVANVLLAIVRKHKVRSSAQHYGGMWSTGWVDKLQELAEAYAKAPVYDPKAAGAWKELGQDSVARHKILEQQLTIKVVPDPEPYASAKEMSDDIHNNKHFLVSNAHCEHPVWSVDENVSFRVVHDVMGHAVSGGDFGWHGENLACMAHAPLLTPNAQKALLTECFTPETLIRTKNGYRPISDIRIGDYVLSGNGQYNRVLNTFSRDHIGDICEIETKSSLGKIRVTKEHPFLSLIPNHPKKTKKTAIYEQYCNPGKCGKFGQDKVDKWHKLEWVEAANLKKKGYLTIGLPTQTNDISSISVPPRYRGGLVGKRAYKTMKEGRLYSRKGPIEFELTPDFLWMIGLYIAEGSSGGGQLSYGLHLNEKDTYAARLIDIFKGYGLTASVWPKGGNGIEVGVSSSMLSEWFRDWLGHGCDNKIIPADLFNLPWEKLQHVVRGVLDGDGCYGENVLGQTSPILALQIAECALRGGGMPSISTNVNENKKDSYYITNAEPSTTVNNKNGRAERRRGDRGYCDVLNHRLTRIEKISHTYYKGKVYDITVENDPTFVVQNVIVHNCIGQTAYAAYYRSFGPQKVAFLDEFLEDSERENPAGHSGVHPSQTFAPTSMPSLDPSPEPEGIKEKGFAAPHMPGSTEPGVFAKLAALRDPNYGWQSGHAPQQGMNAYTDMSVQGPRGTTDPLDAHAVMQNASLIDSKWSTWLKEDGTPDREKMRQAIVNAFRVVLLSPRKDLRDNAMHYQDISHIPGNELDPAKYWDALETARQNWNVKHHGEETRYMHLLFKKLLPKLNGVIFAHHPHMTMDQVHQKTNELIYGWRVEEEHQVMQKDAEKSEDKQKPANEIENKVNKGIEKRIKNFIGESVPEMFAHTGAETDQIGFDMDIPVVEKDKPQKERKYGAFMGTHLNAIAQVSEHSDNILDAAIEDVEEHSASGHHFRAQVLSLGISGVGPKVCSFAWLLLQPMTSQLGTIDTHMMDALGHNYEKSMSTRDYFNFERQLQAGRDASGYEHIPLGAFQWGMWDYKRTGPGSHQDHSAMAVHNPKDHNMIDWQAKQDPIGPGSVDAKADWHKNAPWWWKQTEEARRQTGEEFDNQIGNTVPKNKIPFKVESKNTKTAKPQVAKPTPWLSIGQDIHTGIPGQTYATFISRTLGIPAHEFFDTPEHALGRYHPNGSYVEVVEGKIDQNIYDHLKDVLNPASNMIQ